MHRHTCKRAVTKSQKSIDVMKEDALAIFAAYRQYIGFDKIGC
jgi:hypothetical protein